jgi:hypothetical protein
MTLRCAAHPFRFIQYYGTTNVGGALRAGIVHAAYCLGCCWLLMLLSRPAHGHRPTRTLGCLTAHAEVRQAAAAALPAPLFRLADGGYAKLVEDRSTIRCDD